VAGFSRSAVLTIVGLFVITATLEQTGVVQLLADRLAQLGGTHETRMIAIAAGAVLLPAAVSGMATLFTTANIIVSASLHPGSRRCSR
jgi:Na+/H+ antiporter NhaD/arsenite permease-like protein